MRIRRGAATQQARLQGDKPKVHFIPMAADLAKPERALVDLDDGRCVKVSRRPLAGGAYVGGNRGVNYRRRRNQAPAFDPRLGFPGTSPWSPLFYSVPSNELRLC